MTLGHMPACACHRVLESLSSSALFNYAVLSHSWTTLIYVSQSRRCPIMTADEPNLRVRINQIDYTVEPAGLLDNTVLPKVPVIRIYGESSAGEKACVHVHQVYPYFFVEYLGKMSPADGECLARLGRVPADTN